MLVHGCGFAIRRVSWRHHGLSCSICHGSTSQPSQWPSVTAPDPMFLHVLNFHSNPLTTGGTSHHFPVIFGAPAAYSRFWLCGFGAAWASSAGDVRQAKWEMPYMHELCNARTFSGRCSLAICALNACNEVTGHYPFWLMDLGMTNFSMGTPAFYCRKLRTNSPTAPYSIIFHHSSSVNANETGKANFTRHGRRRQTSV